MRSRRRALHGQRHIAAQSRHEVAPAGISRAGPAAGEHSRAAARLVRPADVSFTRRAACSRRRTRISSAAFWPRTRISACSCRGAALAAQTHRRSWPRRRPPATCSSSRIVIGTDGFFAALFRHEGRVRLGHRSVDARVTHPACPRIPLTGAASKPLAAGGPIMRDDGPSAPARGRSISCAPRPNNVKPALLAVPARVLVAQPVAGATAGARRRCSTSRAIRRDRGARRVRSCVRADARRAGADLRRGPSPCCSPRR